jgi:hypothetical protein
VVAAVAEMHWCSEDSSKYYSNLKGTTRWTMFLTPQHMAVVALVIVLAGLMLLASAGQLTLMRRRSYRWETQLLRKTPRLRPAWGDSTYFVLRSFGAHIDNYITINGVPVHRLTAGTGFYCDVPPADYVIGIARHKTNPRKVSVAAGQSRYICVMLHHLGGVAPRSGALTSDQ